MAKQNLSEQLDLLVEALIARPATASRKREPKANAQLQALARIAAELLDLPRQDFKVRLKSDLARRISMGSKPVLKAQNRQTATAYLTVSDAAAAIEFYKKAFGATEVMRLIGPGTKIGHAEIRIGNSKIYLSDEFPDFGAIAPQGPSGSPVKMDIVVDDVDAVAARAIAAGAKEIRAAQDQFYGMRTGQVADPFGYVWNISTVLEDLTGDEMQKRYDDLVKQGAFAQRAQKPDETRATRAVRPIPEGFHTLTPYLAVNGAARLIDFFKEGFGAVEKFRVNRPGSELVMHAEMRIGDSVLELADASDEFGARVLGNSLHVDDVNALYQQALRAGATDRFAPIEQSYGDLEAGVKDPAGNYWTITEIRKTGHRTEDTRTILPYLNLVGAAEFVEFAKRAFGAREVSMFKAPDGKVIHARLRIGDSILALGEAHAERGIILGALHMYVPNVDEVYATAVREGIKVLRPLRDEPYGDRAAVLQDAFGNWWFPSTHIKDLQF
jgi:PhnB protein